MTMESRVRKAILKWVLAVVITLSAAVYQRMTGPTHPLRGRSDFCGNSFSYRLPRTHGGDGGQRVELAVSGAGCRATLVYRRYKTGDDWSRIDMVRDGELVAAELPHQPPAGKLEYHVLLQRDGAEQSVPADRTAIIRFKGGVPNLVLIPHVLFMFLAMLVSTAAGIEALLRGPRLRRDALVASGLLFVGGMILGPIVQKFAFGEFWTGVPWGWDLTDNKTLIAMIGWAIALAVVWRNRNPRQRWWALGAAVLLLAIYSIPHSALGSELDYQSGQVKTGG